MRSGILLTLILSVLMSGIPLPAQAGFMRDTCPAAKAKGRVRADMVFDLETGKILKERNARASFHPASLTKLMSLALIFEDVRKKRLKLNERVTLQRTGGEVDGRTSSIRSMTLGEAIEGVANASLNNALDGIAAKYGTGKFVARMNATAREWGMKDTHFVNPTGWPTAQSMQMQRSTLYDMATLVRGIWLGYSDEADRYTGKKQVRIAGLKKPLNSTNNLLEISEAPRAQPYEGVIGGKTGYTCYSGWHLIAVYEDPALKRRMVAMTVGHATGKSRDDYMRKLLDEAKPKLVAFDKAEKRRIEQERREAEREAARRLAEEKKAKALAAEAAARKVGVQTVATTVPNR